MKEKEFKQFLEDFNSVIEERCVLSFQKMKKTKEYKNKKDRYNIISNKILENCTIEDTEDFKNSIYDIQAIENTYVYIQGFIDGILLRENQENKI